MQRLVNNLLAAASLGMALASGSLATAAGHGGGHPSGMRGPAVQMAPPINPSRTIPNRDFVNPNQRNLHDPRWYGHSYPYYGYYGYGYTVDPDFVVPFDLGSHQAADNAVGADSSTPAMVSPRPTLPSKIKDATSTKKPVVSTITAAPTPEDNFRKASSCLWMAKTFAAGNRPEKVREYAQKAVELAPDTSVAREARELLDSVKE